jgi:hypothetical protein
VLTAEHVSLVFVAATANISPHSNWQALMQHAGLLAALLQMVITPGASITQRSVRSNLLLVLLGVAYGAVLLASWSPDTLHLMMPGSLEEGLRGEQQQQQKRWFGSPAKASCSSRSSSHHAVLLWLQRATARRSGRLLAGRLSRFRSINVTASLTHDACAHLPPTPAVCCAGGFNPQFFPTLESVQTLFGRPFTAASFLLHVLAINLISARSAFIDGALSSM